MDATSVQHAQKGRATMNDAQWRRASLDQRYAWLHPRPVPKPVEVVLPVDLEHVDWAEAEKNRRKAVALASIHREMEIAAAQDAAKKAAEHDRWRATNALAQLTTGA
jgi:hypothetical protein